jgi:hypothetical protein
MTRRCAPVLAAALALILAFVATAQASAATRKTNHTRRAHAICMRHTKNWRRHHRRLCVVHAKRKNARHVTHKPAPKKKAPAPTATPSRAAAPVSGGQIVGLDASVVGWSDMTDRLGQVVSQTGAHWMRQDFFWSTIEPRKGVFDFSHYDEFVQDAAEHGVHLLPLLFDVPSWAGANYDSIPADPSDYAAYVAAVVHRYGPHGTFWASHPNLSSYAIQTFELWNEPYYDNGNNGDYDPGRYARMAKAAGIAGRAADSSAQFLLAAETQAQKVGSSWVWWVDALYDAVPDLNRYFDGVAVHPYGTDLSGVSFPTPGLAFNGYEQLRRVEAIRQEFVRHDASNKPLWITEVGWPTCSSGSDRCTTTEGQAQRLQTVFNYAHTSWKSYLKAVFVYSYDDAHGGSSDPEDNYGLAYNNGSPKPALSVFKANEG